MAALRTTIITFLQIKNILLFLALIFYIIALLNFTDSSSNDSRSHVLSTQYSDYYNFAMSQKNALNLEILSLFFMALYSLKYFQIFKLANLMFIAFKKSAKEYVILCFIIIICFIGLTLFTYYIFGQHISEYQNFLDSIFMNFKIFLLSENLEIATKFMKFNKSMSVMIFFIFILAFRYFLFYLFYPILIEHYRMESENFVTNADDDEAEMSMEESNILF